MAPRPQDCNLLVVSDLHLSEGRPEETKRFSRLEDFFFDEEFARFLRHYQGRARRDGIPWHLVIAGDFLDLLQVVTTDGAGPALQRGPRHPRYGLDCGEAQTVYKVGRIANGHWQLFEALAEFLAAGNLLTIVSGNHDVELTYAAVRTALVDEIRKAGAEAARRSGSAAPAIPPDAVRFEDWFHHEPGLVWIEHGNRYEAANSFRHWLSPLLPAPPGPTADIDLPLGSMFVRYLFNRVERLEPFADNMKPISKFVSWMIRKHPVEAMKFLFGDGRTMLRKLQRAFARPSPDAYAAREREHEERLEALARGSGISTPTLQKIDRLASASILEKTSGFRTSLLAFLVRTGAAFPVAVALLVALVAAALVASARVASVVVPMLGAWISALHLPGVVATVADGILVVAGAAGVALLARWALRPEEKPGPSYLVEPATEIARELKVSYVVMGHTHDPELCQLPRAQGPGAPERPEYFNTASWTKVFSEEEQLIRDAVELVFVQGIRKGGSMQMKLMEWVDGAGEPRLVKLFSDARG